MGNFNRGDRGGRNFNKRDSGRDFGWGESEKPEMFSTVCADCGDDCEVPFRPNGKKPVYCRNCFRKNEGGGDDFFGSDRSDRSERRFEKPRFEKFEKPRFEKPRAESNGVTKEQFEMLSFKMDLILKALNELNAKKPEKTEKAEKAEKSEPKVESEAKPAKKAAKAKKTK